ncbi:LVIVD repeat-containing protein [Massilia sp. TSP1-1-2]|uniref:LVIVD repeat-containing protein n=1 Tax=Massilia sp. TSP1-1-2 TaxID=2804649 RepID=UPI003CF36027
MKHIRPFPAPSRSAIGALLALCIVGLSGCGGGGGGGGGATLPPPPVVVQPGSPGDFGGKQLASVARTGVAGNWGYTAPDGARYALMGTAKGILVLDLRDSANVRVVDEIDGPTNTPSPGVYWREMRVYGTHAYIVSEQDNVRGGVMILDLSALPASVRFVKSFAPRDGTLRAHTIDIDTARGLAYLQRPVSVAPPAPAPISAPLLDAPAPAVFGGAMAAAHTEGEHEHGGPSDGSVEVWDLKTDPENPRYITTFNLNKSVHDMTAVGNLVYVAEGTANSWSIWDLTTPAAPRLLVRWVGTPGNFAHNIWPSGDGTFVVTTEEVPAGLPARVWRLNGAAAPTQLSTFKVGTGTPHNVIMEGNMAYLSHYTEGAVAVDLSNPAVPKVVMRVDTSALAGPGYSGCWGVYKFPGLPLLTCSDIETGFHLISITP